MTRKPILAFVSTRFLFPADSGGKIRTSQILRGLKGGAFHVRLLMPGSDLQRDTFAANIESVCDEFVSWQVRERNVLLNTLRKMTWFLRPEPIPVISDWSRAAQQCVERELGRDPDLVVFDFPHSAILAPGDLRPPSVMFTHNVEAEIFERHIAVAKNRLMRAIWTSQHRKMVRFEQHVLNNFDGVVAVSERDRAFFQNKWQVRNCSSIPTGVDTEFLQYVDPSSRTQVVFCGSMNWMANIDGVEYFHREVWPRVRQRAPEARMKVVGRTPPDEMVRRICDISPEWEFTGFVDDVRDHVAGAAAFVIPLRVGGGTRIKAFEAMAMGCPVVSTSIGIEGLPVKDGVHFLRADQPEEMAERVVNLLQNEDSRRQIAVAARKLVENEFGYRKAAEVFERICLQAIDAGQRG